MNNILRISFLRFKKIEVQTLTNRVIEIVEKHDPETLLIKETFDILVKQEPQIKQLKIGYAPHPITESLNVLRNRRDAYMQEIIYKVKTIERARRNEMEEALQVAKPIINFYLYRLYRESEETITGTISQLHEYIVTHEEMAAAVTTLGLISNFDELRTVNTTIARQYDRRGAIFSKRPKMNTSMIVAKLKSYIETLYKQIEVAQITNQDLDYQPLIDELNEEIAHYRSIIRARESYNKRKAEQEALDNDNVDEIDNDIVVETEPETTSATTSPDERMETMQMGNSTNGEVENEEVLETLDKKKTAAVSSKQTRLPDVSNEA